MVDVCTVTELGARRMALSQVLTVFFSASKFAALPPVVCDHVASYIKAADVTWGRLSVLSTRIAESSGIHAY